MNDSAVVLNNLNKRDNLRFEPLLLALGPFLATVPCNPQLWRGFTDLLSNNFGVDAFLPAMTGTVIVASLALVILASRAKAPRPISLCAERVCAVLYVAAVVVLSAGLVLFEAPSWLLVAVGCVAGVAFVPLVAMWARVFCTDLRNAMLYGAIACMVSAASVGVMELLAPAMRVATMGVFALVGTVSPLVCARPGDARAVECAFGPSAERPDPPDASAPATTGQSPVAEVLRQIVPVVWVPLLGLFLYVLVTCLYSYQLEGFPVSTELTGSLLAGAIAMCVCLARIKTPLVLLVNTAIIPVCIGVCIVLHSFPAGSPVFVLGASSVFAPLLFMAIYAISCMVATSSLNGYPVSLVSGLTLFAIAVIAFVGFALGRSLAGQVNMGELCGVLMSFYFALVLIELGFSTWHKLRAPAEQERPVISPELGGEDLVDQIMHQRLEQLARDHGLTPRELDVLDGINRGYSATFIANTLILSPSTVRTHVGNIYRKLGIATRSELLDLLRK